jgi:alginate O-acetyltransferase complex protein AlgI
MTLTHILVFSLGALLAGCLLPKSWRIPFLLISSLLAVYLLQPSTPIRHLDFWIPGLSIALVAFTWAVTLPSDTKAQAGDRVVLLVILVVILVVSLTRYLGPLCCLTPSRPPDLPQVLMVLGLVITVIAIPYFLPGQRHFFSILAVMIILGLFVVLKTPALAQASSAGLRAAHGQSPSLASPLDLPWLGFSYLAFRLLQVIRDRQTGKLPAHSLGEMGLFALFFPAYTAGPIDRSLRFITEARQIASSDRDFQQAAANTVSGGQRILVGTFKKFVLADSLALISLNPQNAAQITSPYWTWVLLLAYTLRIYFDFSGYTDVAIGLGCIMGFHLPENFDRPYLRPNLTAFWNSWHMTLASWFRAYIFNPLTRALRTRPRKWPVWAIILVGQTITMTLIGLWHGITPNFLIWGLWHGIGLFIHNRWSELVRPFADALAARPALGLASRFISGLLTFLFVSLGWVWFALPNPGLTLQVFQKLFGLR